MDLQAHQDHENPQQEDWEPGFALEEKAKPMHATYLVWASSNQTLLLAGVLELLCGRPVHGCFRICRVIYQTEAGRAETEMYRTA